jgi:hypothetical protein
MSSSTAAAPARKGPVPEESEFRRLAREMESPKGLDPIPPDQIAYFLPKTEPPLQRLLALVRMTTCAKGRRSAHCVDEAGKELRLADLRRMLAMDWGNFRRTVEEAKTRGLIRIGDRHHRAHPHRVFLCGTVAESVGYKELAEEATSLYRLVLLTPEQRKLYDAWPVEKQTRFYADFERAVKYKEEIEQEAIALAREITEGELNRVYAEHELPKKRLPKRRAEPTRVQLRLIESVQTESVPTPGVESVQTEKSKSVQAENGRASLLCLENYQSKEGKSVGQSSERPTDRHADAGDYGAKTQALKTLLIEEYARFPESPKPRLLAQILATLDGAPLEWLRLRIRQRIGSATSMGQALNLAEDVAARWNEEAPARAAAAAAARRHTEANEQEMQQLYRETLTDPRASHEDKELAREFLKTSAATGGAL